MHNAVQRSDILRERERKEERESCLGEGSSLRGEAFKVKHLDLVMKRGEGTLLVAVRERVG